MDKSRKQLMEPKMLPPTSRICVQASGIRHLVLVRKWPVLLLLACFVGVFFLMAARPVAANGSPWVRWKVNVTFPNSKLNAWLTIERGHTTPAGDHIVDDRETFPISCTAYGNPTIVNGQAIFDGSSFYRCDLPSIQAEAMNLWNLYVPDSCEAKRPYVRGMIMLEGNPVDPSPGNPIFFRDDIRFDAPLDLAAQEANLAVRFGQAAAESDAFEIDPFGHTVGAYFARSDFDTFAPVFRVDGKELSATPAYLSQPASISTLAGPIYFGYSPVTGEYFEGSIGPLEVDPVCPTTG